MGIVIFRDEKISWGSKKAHHLYVYDWFDTNQYYKYEMSYLNGFEFSSGVLKTQFTEVRWWMQDNLNGEILVVYDDHSSSGHGVTIYLYFQYETDMIAFKLRWV